MGEIIWLALKIVNMMTRKLKDACDNFKV